jgi:hypothetical protein
LAGPDDSNPFYPGKQIAATTGLGPTQALHWDRGRPARLKQRVHASHRINVLIEWDSRQRAGRPRSQ